jgi:hypothetical protein
VKVVSNAGPLIALGKLGQLTQQPEQQEVVHQQVVYHLVPLHACQVNGGIPPMFQTRELSAGWRYTSKKLTGFYSLPDHRSHEASSPGAPGHVEQPTQQAS